MKEKLNLSFNKTLKLTNVLITNLDTNEFNEYAKKIEKLTNFSKLKGLSPIGPIIQYTKINTDKNGKLQINTKILQQMNNYLHSNSSEFKMESIIRIKNCMYCRYTGEESKLKFAYDKINLTAFEEDIPLKGDSYTIFVEQQNDNIVADVFMERAD